MTPKKSPDELKPEILAAVLVGRRHYPRGHGFGAGQRYDPACFSGRAFGSDRLFFKSSR
jgi:hypothetical protein